MKSNLWDVCILMVSALKTLYQCKLLIEKVKTKEYLLVIFCCLRPYVFCENSDELELLLHRYIIKDQLFSDIDNS